MAATRAQVHAVETGPSPIERYRSLLGKEAWSQFAGAMRAFAVKLRGRVVWNVNSAGRGGGVAELLAALIPYDRSVGVDERWLVIDGTPEFFQVTKKIHMLLHGVSPDGSELSPAERAEYEDTLGRNTAALVELMKPGDVAVLHDPQTAGLVPALTSHGVKVIWRSHVGVDQPNDMVRGAWRFLTPYLTKASAFVFSRKAYVWDGPDGSRVHIIAPCIDAFSTKNQDMDGHTVAEILRASGILSGSDGEATFLRNDGTAGRVRRRADLTAPLPTDARIVVQVSRWDRLKDPSGVTRGFAQHVAPHVDSWLVLAGPTVTSGDVDPEGVRLRRGRPAAGSKGRRGARDRGEAADHSQVLGATPPDGAGRADHKPRLTSLRCRSGFFVRLSFRGTSSRGTSSASGTAGSARACCSSMPRPEKGRVSTGIHTSRS